MPLISLMNLLNMQVKHESFGQGNVIEHNDNVLTVCFECGNKKFVFPDAFGTHLIPLDQKAADIVEELKQEIFQERRKVELELEEQKQLEYEEQVRAIEREKLLKNHKLSPASQAVFWCDEEEQAKVFSDWEVFTGTKKSGPNEGKPNRLVRLHQNSACLITERAPGIPEQERRITGVFMVSESFVGSLCDTGYIPAHSLYRIQLTEQESRQILFWNYYVNERAPQRMTWNSGNYRYFDNVWMAQVLRDIVALRQGTDDYELAQNFFQYFCQMNQISEADLPKPDGALVRVGA